MESLGFSVTLSPFHMLKTSFRGEASVKQLIDLDGQVVKLIGLLVTYKTTRTKKKESMAFGTFLDVTGDFFEKVHLPVAYK